MFSGLLMGLLFGYILKRSRFCPTGTIRDIYLEKRGYNIILILALIFTQGVVYHTLVKFGLVPEPACLSFPALSIAIGSFIFGFGAVLSNGCITATLIKCGDGRLIGIVSLLSFITAAYIAIETGFNKITNKLAFMYLLPDEFVKTIPISPILICLIAVIILYYIMYKHYNSHKPKFKLPSQYTGIRHFLFEKSWSKEITVVFIGIIAGLGFYFSFLNGREGGFAVPAPLLSWVNLIIPVDNTAVGWATDPNGIGWSSMFVLGIFLGSLSTTISSGEFSIVKINKKTLLKTIIGSMLMGFGAVLGQGCLLGNGLVATAQLSVKGWFALVFLALGIWTSSRLFLKKI